MYREPWTYGWTSGDMHYCCCLCHVCARLGLPTSFPRVPPHPYHLCHSVSFFVHLAFSLNTMHTHPLVLKFLQLFHLLFICCYGQGKQISVSITVHFFSPSTHLEIIWVQPYYSINITVKMNLLLVSVRNHMKWGNKG